MSLWEAVVLGAVQGLSEFLPISSSGHLILIPWIFSWKDPGLAFDVFLHLGTALALILYFFGDLWRVFTAGLASLWERRVGFEIDRLLFWWIVIGTIPAVVAGFALGDYIEAHFRSPLLVAFFLASVGFLMFWMDWNYPATRSLEEMTGVEALLIGIAQAFALLPGVSRSGSTLAMARRLGFNRTAAARFSFLLSVPVIFGALALEGRKIIGHLDGLFGMDYLIAGLFSSFLFGILSIHFMLQFLRQSSLRIFAWYRLFVAASIVFMSLFLNK